MVNHVKHVGFATHRTRREMCSRKSVPAPPSLGQFKNDADFPDQTDRQRAQTVFNSICVLLPHFEQLIAMDILMRNGPCGCEFDDDWQCLFRCTRCTIHASVYDTLMFINDCKHSYISDQASQKGSEKDRKRWNRPSPNKHRDCVFNKKRASEKKQQKRVDTD